MSDQELRRILSEYRAGLTAELGNALHAVILYGSQARRDASAISDVDVLCVMQGAFDYGDLIDRTSELTARLSLEHDAILSRTFATRHDYETRRLPFLMNVRREGVAF